MSNLAEQYDFGLFENYGNTAPEIREPVKKPKKVTKISPKTQPRPKIKRNWAQIIAYSLVFVTVTGIAGLRINTEVELTILTDQIQETQQLLAEAQATETQLRLGMDKKLNDLNLEHYARTALGMRPIERSQVTYINTQKEDKGTVYQPVEEPSIFERVKRFMEKIMP
ncbi:MAG: hypothetical protein HDQ88_09270 [Clostridia bacterium]|nr:hypothetical protein [Clostridia bacterium]